MCSDVAIQVRNISKAYHIYDKPQDRLKQALLRGRKQFYREFKALDNVSFDVKKGEMVGIIGRNGSGKSTLLQIICGTLAPSFGAVEVNGRVAALLELGAGFNPEFTGKENIYMNASILGLSKKEIDAKYDEIVAFADIGDFVGQPVKTYSSGMYVRLAFAVAINVDPDILIVDESLSVGDIKFQIKCINKFKEFQEKGVTILFVSHDIFTVRSFCKKAVWLHNGAVKEIGEITKVSSLYSEYMYGDDSSAQEVLPGKRNGVTQILMTDFKPINRWGTHEGIIEYAEVLNKQMEPQDIFKVNESMIVKIIVNIEDIGAEFLGFSISLKDKNGVDLIVSSTIDGSENLDVSHNKIEIVFELTNYLATGEYVLVVAVEDRSLGTPQYYDYIEGAGYFKSEATGMRFGVFHQPVALQIKYREK